MNSEASQQHAHIHLFSVLTTNLPLTRCRARTCNVLSREHVCRCQSALSASLDVVFVLHLHAFRMPHARMPACPHARMSGCLCTGRHAGRLCLRCINGPRTSELAVLPCSLMTNRSARPDLDCEPQTCIGEERQAAGARKGEYELVSSLLMSPAIPAAAHAHRPAADNASGSSGAAATATSHPPAHLPA